MSVNWTKAHRDFDKRRRAFIKSKGECNRCKSKKDLTLDHIIPKCIGGITWHESNWQVLCAPCNNKIKSVEDQRLYYLHLQCYNPLRYRDVIKAQSLSELTDEQLLDIQKRLSDAINNDKSHLKNTKRKKSLKNITQQLIKRGVK